MTLADIVFYGGIILAIGCVLYILWCTYLFIRNKWMSKKYDQLIEAICEYRMACGQSDTEPQVDFCDLADYDEVSKQYFNWRTSAFLEGSKAELIKDYIKKEKK